MTNYESLKNMSVEQMTIALCCLVLPFAEALHGGKLPEDEQRDIIKRLKDFLQSEVKKPGEK